MKYLSFSQNLVLSVLSILPFHARAGDLEDREAKYPACKPSFDASKKVEPELDREIVGTWVSACSHSYKFVIKIQQSKSGDLISKKTMYYYGAEDCASDKEVKERRSVEYVDFASRLAGVSTTTILESYIKKPRVVLGSFDLARSQGWPIENRFGENVINKSLSLYRAQNVFRIGTDLVLIQLNRGDQDTVRPFDDYQRDGETLNRFKTGAMTSYTGSEVYCKVSDPVEDIAFKAIVEVANLGKLKEVRDE